MSDDISCQQSKFLINLMSIFIFIGVLGAAKPVLFNGGGSMAKYMAKNKQLELVNEQGIESYIEAALFGEESVKYPVSNIQSSEESSSIEFIFALDYWIALILLLLSFIILFPKVRSTWFYNSLLVISLWVLCQSIGTMLNGGKRFSELAILAHATRWGLPLCLWLFIYWQNNTKLKPEAQAARLHETLAGKFLIVTMCFCAGATFAVHGWEAYSLNPPFQDLIYNFGALIGWDVSTSINHSILKSVGCMDLFLAASLIFVRNPKILIWMAAWGFITAFSRPLTIGFGAWPEFAMRIANGALPLSIFLIYRNQTQEQASVQEVKTQNMEMIYE